MRTKSLFLFFVLISIAAADSFAYQAGGDKISKNDFIPLDNLITTGSLPNGLKYMIRANDRPEKRVELRLVLNEGSILEREDQLGLAHFVEHMAFNGTANFAEQDLVKYLESVGMRFGPDINAYTSFDETVYMLQLPTDSAGVVDTGLQILRDWAGNVSFDSLEVEKERGVVIEEWRGRRGGPARIQDKQFPVLLHRSRYPERLPIGTLESLQTFAQQRLKDFYTEWYRPDLMSIVVVGDIDPAAMEKRIIELFSDLTWKEGSIDRPDFDVPDHQQTLYSIESDPEAGIAQIGLLFKHDNLNAGTFGAYDEELRRSLFASMLNQRLSELTQQVDPPFIGAGASDGTIVRTKSAFSLSASVTKGQYLRALESMLTEVERVRQHGFSESEFERVKTSRMRRMEVQFNERQNEQSAQLAAEYVRHLVYGESVPGIEKEFALFQRILPSIKLSEINGLLPQLVTDNNLVVLVSGPTSDEQPLPTIADLSNVIAASSKLKPTIYKDVTTESPLLPTKPKKGQVVAEETIESLGVTLWTLSNGSKVVLRPTDFKSDEVLFSATSPGGVSLASDENYMSAAFSTNLIGGSGVGSFNAIDLSKKLAGKIARVRPFISNLDEGFTGSASPTDLETLFQLSYLFATAPRADSTVFESFMSRLNSMLETLSASPQAAFGDTLSVTLNQYNHRARPMSSAVLSEVDLQKGFSFYKDRFSDFSDFTFYLVGSFELATIKPLVETYLASLPSTGRVEEARDTGIRTPSGVVQKEVFKGVEEQSQVALVFSGDAEWSMASRRRLALLKDVLQTRLREVLREDLGGTYGVSVLSNFQDKPHSGFQFSVAFGCAPDRVDEMISSIWENINDLKSAHASETHLDNAREAATRAWETGLKENGYWITALQFYVERGMDATRILVNPSEELNLISANDLSEAAKTYLNEDRVVQVILYPESRK